METTQRSDRTIHFIVSCMGRLDFVKQTIEAAISQPNSTYTFVDYSCPQKAGEWVAANYPTANVVTVAGRRNWWPAEARNAGARQWDDGWLCFLDSDIILHPEYSKVVLAMIKPGIYLPAPQKPGIFGMLVCSKSDFDQFGGYDEIVRPYGAEDVELKMSLNRLGLEQVELPERLMTHIDHDDSLRTNLCDIKEKMVSERINGLYIFAKDVLIRSGEPYDRTNLQRIYNYSKERFLAGYPWLSWPEPGRPPEMFPAILRTLTDIGKNFAEVAAEIWGGARGFRIRSANGDALYELLSIYDRHRITVRAPGLSGIRAMTLAGERFSIPVADGLATLDLCPEPIFLLDEVELIKDIAVRVGPGDGPRLVVELAFADGFSAPAVEIEIAVDGRPLERRSLALEKFEPLSIEAAVDPGSPEQTREVVVKVTANGITREIMRRTTFLTAPKITDEESVSLTPPEHAARFHVGGADCRVDVIPGGDKGEPNMSVDVAWGWTPTALVCWMTRRDDVWGDETKDGEAILICVQPQNERAHFASDIQFTLLWRDGKSWVEVVKSQLDAAVVLENALTMEDAGARRRMVVRLPFESMGITPEAGLTAGLSMLFGDDGAGRKGRLAWGGGIANGKSPRLFNEITLGA